MLQKQNGPAAPRPPGRIEDLKLSPVLPFGWLLKM
jgi:hypothetical protein